MSFQGSLAELHLPDILQLMAVSGKTGAFHLTSGPLEGLIYLNEGKIVHAVLENESGEDAIYSLATWRDGDFRFEAGDTTTVRSITRTNTNLLMEAARRLDEWRVLSKKIPSVDLIPEFVLQQHKEGQINLNTSEWLILSKIDGQRSVKAIAEATRISVFDAAKVLYGLVAASLIHFKSPPPAAVVEKAPARSASDAPAPTPRPMSATARAAAPAPAPAQPPSTMAAPRSASAAASSTAPADLAKLKRVREVCNAVLGTLGADVVEKHYQKARTDIEKGAGPEAITEAVHQISRAAAILKGPAMTETLLTQLRDIK